METQSPTRAQHPTRATNKTHGSWRSKQTPESVRWRRRTRRTAVTLVAVGLLAWLGTLLFAPFSRSSAILVTALPRLAAQGQSPLNHWLPAYAGNDVAALSQLPVVAKSIDLSASDTSTAATKPFKDQLLDVCSSDQTLLLYLRAMGLDERGRAALLWSGAEQSAGPKLISVGELLSDLRRCNAKSVVLMLDVDQPPPDRATGQIVDDFVASLARECQAARPAPIWILVSHQQGERPFASDALARSAFGLWLERGLAGEADLNGDQLIGLDELHRYVMANVGAFVRHVTGGAQTQTPLLLACGGQENRFVRPLGLVPARKDLLNGSADFDKNLAALSAKKEAAIAGAKALAASSPATGEKEAKSPKVDVKAQSNSSATSALTHDMTELTARDLLQAGWQLRDDLESGATARDDPRRVMPHLWRGFVDQLIAADNALRSGVEGTSSVVATELRRLVLPIQAWANGENKPAIPAGRLASLMITSSSMADDWQAHSFGMETLKAQVEQHPLSPELAGTIQTFDSLTTDFDREAFNKFLAELPPKLAHYTEIQLARTLLTRVDLDDSLAREAIALRRKAESLAARRNDVPYWVSEDILAADQRRTAGEWLLLDAAKTPDAEKVQALFEESRRRYQQIEESLALVDRASALRDHCLHEVPYLVEWTVLCRTVSSARKPSPKDVLAFIDSLVELQTLINLLQPMPLDRLKNAVVRLEACREQVGLSYTSDYLRSTLALGPESASDLAALRLLRETPLLSAKDRLLLENELPQIERTLLSRFQAATNFRETGPSTTTSDATARDITQLYCHLGRLGVSDPVPAVYQALKDALQEVEESGSETQTSAEAFERVLSEYQRYLAQVANVQVDEITSATPSDRLRRLEAADRASRLISAQSGVLRSRQDDSHSLLQRDKLAATLAWQASRAARLAPFAPTSDFDFLQSTATIYRAAGNRLVSGIASGGESEPLQLELPESISLDNQDSSTLTLGIQNEAHATRDVWIVMDYDPSLISMSDSSDRYSASIAVEDASESLFEGGEYPLHRPDRSGVAPTLTLAGSSGQACRWTVERRAPSALPTTITMWVISRNQEGGEDAAIDIRRRSLIVRLPYPPLFQVGFSGVPGTVGTNVETAELFPFPNHKLAFQVLIKGTQATPKCTLAAYAFTRPVEEQFPPFAIESAQANSLIERYTSAVPIATVAEFALPTDGTPVAIPFPAVGGKPDSPLVPLDHGLLLAATDPASGRVVLRQVTVRPQHPSRYLEPEVRFDPRSKRLLIGVSAIDPALLPEEGCQVTCHFADRLDASAARRLSGVVTSNQPAAMFAELVESQAWPLTLYMNIDGYPRAFIYSIPRSATPAEIPRELGAAAVRVLAPFAGTAIQSPARRLTATLEVDAPVGTDWSVARLETGLDRDRDRELRNENPIVLRSEREVRVTLDEMGPGGLFSVRTEVRDFQLAIPADDIQAGRVNVLGHLILSDRSVWSRPVEVVFDDEPPVIRRLLLGKGSIVAGEPVQASVEASDGGLSGVASVEIAVDVGRGGEFAGETKGLPATKVGDRWMLTLDTSKLTPGRYGVLARAVDVVGNEGNYAREWLDVVTLEQMAADQANALNSIQGYVTYRGKPMAGFTVQLVPEPKAGEDASQTEPMPISAGKTDDKGSFAKSGVPPGSYTVNAEGLYANRRRVGIAKVVVPPGPTPVPILDIEVDPR